MQSAQAFEIVVTVVVEAVIGVGAAVAQDWNIEIVEATLEVVRAPLVLVRSLSEDVKARDFRDSVEVHVQDSGVRRILRHHVLSYSFLEGLDVH